PNATPPASTRSSASCSAIPDGSRRCPPTPARSAAPTPPHASPTSSRRWRVKSDDPTRDLDLSSPRHVHIVGIGGAGMSAIATVLARMGHHVTGSDLKESRGLERLRLLDVHADVGHRVENVPPDADAVVVST